MSVHTGGRGPGHMTRALSARTSTPAPVNSVLPVITGEAVVGQRLYASTGTWTNSPSSFFYQWYNGGVAINFETNDNYLIIDADVGATFTCQVVAYNGNYSSPASSVATAAAANISLTNAITAFTRTSASGVTPMTWSVTFGSNVYAGYMTRWEVAASNSFSDATNLQSVDYQLTNDDLQAGATVIPTGLTAPTATQYLRLTVFTTSPNGVGYLYTYPNPITPTDPAGHRYWKYNVTSGSYSVLREIIAALTVGGADVATGRIYSYTPSNCEQTTGSFHSAYWFDGNTATAGSFDTNTVPLPNAVTIDFSSNIDLHELRLQQYSSAAFPPAAFTFAYSDDNVSFTNVVNASGLTWTADEIKTWSW